MSVPIDAKWMDACQEFVDCRGDNFHVQRDYDGLTKCFPANENGALFKGIPRHPIVEDDGGSCAGATVLGRITIGKGWSIGGNVWLTHGVPPGSNVTQARMQSE